jgi:hypothetical protein
MKQATKREFRRTTKCKRKIKKKGRRGSESIYRKSVCFDPVISYRKWREPTTAAQHMEGSKEKKTRVVSHYSSYATASKRQSRTQVCPHHSSFSCKSRSSKGSPNSSKHQKVSTYTPQPSRLSKEMSRVHALNVKSLSTTNSKARWISS